MSAIETRFHGPTNFRGARISVRFMDGGRSDTRFFPFEYGGDGVGYAHDCAFRAFLKVHEVQARPSEYARGATPRGFIYVIRTVAWNIPADND